MKSKLPVTHKLKSVMYRTPEFAEYISIYSSYTEYTRDFTFPHIDGKYPSYQKAKGSQVHTFYRFANTSGTLSESVQMALFAHPLIKIDHEAEGLVVHF